MGRSRTPVIPRGVEYHRVLVGEGRRIGRGILAIVLLILGLLVLGFLMSQVTALLGSLLGSSDPSAEGNGVVPLEQASNMVTIALLIPWSMLIQRWLYGVRPSSLHSVVSRFRFQLFGRALVLIGPLWVAVILLSTAVPEQVAWSTSDLLAMFAITLLLTPLQSAGEEYGLRGLVFRVAGSWGRGARAGLVVGIAVSSVVFVAIHLSADPWRNVYYLAPAVSFALITWRTGGLEIAIVTHALNNTLLFLFDIVMHSDFQSLEERSAGGGDALLLIPAAALALVTAVVWFSTRSAGPARTPRVDPGTVHADGRASRR